MTTATASVRERIRDIVVAELEVEGEIEETGDFVEEYDADSLSLITIVSRVEKELGIRVPKDELSEMNNLSRTYEIVEAHASGAGDAA
ncbi:acyl carrier protein [Streptomyces triticirhizae]|uniref:Acyl carrier protein n=1 Tax=Streptomyces triticirhizae TaxID=2483353 RepID=A0A3M2M6I8_9ACTN|nr:acyl carrier protein [Streptomyces triticirhizae]